MANKNGNLTIGPDQNVPTSKAIIPFLFAIFYSL